MTWGEIGTVAALGMIMLTVGHAAGSINAIRDALAELAKELREVRQRLPLLPGELENEIDYGMAGLRGVEPPFYGWVDSRLHGIERQLERLADHVAPKRRE